MAPKMEGINESGDDSSGGNSSSRRPVKNTEEYRRRRERNNQAVKKSRMKTKMKTQQMVDRVTQLRNENEELEENIKILTKELGILKDLFVAHAGNAHGVQLNDAELARMLEETPEEMDEGVSLLMSLSKGPPL
ncbi:CCAAT/enhancer-binding protein gamma [Procambarus clarkii]|uniref:CCAAT/enhancer-binding protein gamma n=1 Tax=Procambarus clarkii TaxID=6728 RepID=UPI001E676964|nr:CCAAT/enhancer-binding protein gamma-like [Procambarus clarkii]XP_045581573.1 CCAAT/enhancer-binding protein gamma-like [Procambarus clarkii]XP_045581574.1 CCAAT/enhancer-binding protein gamma-like [Procambarus clarkii]XP_045581575.1 CCAAT/enhancer-binding protein gamma-like [Procambarus clarkii]XP_045581576.1 CCAAT/enhancer-binding protein gamma-like [Procambarus clarkii]